MAHEAGAMRLSRDNFGWLVDAVPQVFWIAGADGRISYLSEHFTDLTGHNAAEFVADGRWKEVVHPEDMASLEALWRSARASATESRSYFRLQGRDGEYRWMHSVGRPVLSPLSGGISHWVGGLVDVDAQFSADRSVAEMHREANLKIKPETDAVTRERWRFRSLFHDRNIGVIEIDLAGVKAALDGLAPIRDDDARGPSFSDPVVFDELVRRARAVEMNRTLALMLGFEDADASLLAPGKLLERLGAKNPLAVAVQALCAGTDALDGVAELATADGKQLMVAYAITISEDLTCYATLVDITEQRRAAEMQLAVQSELARANRIATIGALSVSIAHELNQPITSMRIELRSLERALASLDVPPGPIQAGLDRVTRQCERLTQIIQRTGNRVLKQGRCIAVVDLTALAGAIPALLRHEIEEGGVRLQIETPEPCLLRADAGELQQVLVNLVANAIDATSSTPAGARVIRLAVDQEGGFARARVTDSGPGVDEADMARIFDPFYTTKPDGVGMGLQICRTIVESLGGNLRARNVAQGGAMFEFCIPNTAGGLSEPPARVVPV